MESKDNRARIYSKIYPRLKAVTVPAILFAVGLPMLCFSWRRWPNLLIDFGRELYIPWQLNQGAVLYKDIFYFNGPFSPYFNALLFRAFGVHLLTLACVNLLVIILLTYLIYRIFYLTTDMLTAAINAATFLSAFAFAQYQGGNFNFVCPYSHELTHGLFLSFLGIYLFLHYARKQRGTLLFSIGILLGLVFLTKPEVFLAIFIAIISGIVILISGTKELIKKVFKITRIFLLGLCLPCLFFVLYLWQHMALAKVLGSIVIPYTAILKTPVASNLYYRHLLGTDNLKANLKELLFLTSVYLALLLALALISYFINNLSRKNLRIYASSILLGAALFLLPWIVIGVPWFKTLKVLPVAMSGLLVYLFISLCRSHNEYSAKGRLLPLFVMTVFGLLLLSKMMFNTRILHIGFALTLPATLLLVMIFLHQLPISLGRLLKGTLLLRLSWLILIVTALIVHGIITKRKYDLKTLAVGSGMDTIVTYNPEISTRGLLVEATLEKIDQIMQKNETFAAIPEGAMLNYLSRRRNPAPCINFMPPEVEIFTEETILNSLIKNKPDYVVLVDKDTSEYGYPYFGRDYAVKIYSWIKENYTEVWKIGDEPLSGQGFGISIAKRASGVKERF